MIFVDGTRMHQLGDKLGLKEWVLLGSSARLKRGATDRHRAELFGELGQWVVVLIGPACRDWGRIYPAPRVTAGQRT